jgi:hypothetical protein
LGDWLPKINTSVLWFDDIKLINEGIFDTPLGRLSIRQTLILGFFGLLSWLTLSAVNPIVGDIAVSGILAGAVMIAGVVLASWRIKTVPIERSILLALGVGRRSPAKRGRAAPERKASEPAPPVKSSKMHGIVGEPVKIVGVLRDPQTGAALAQRGFSVIVDGRLRYKDVTDEQGAFEVVYLPEHPGLVRIEVQPDGVAASEKIELTIAPI